jgi:2Fe-2S ferredoxin
VVTVYFKDKNSLYSTDIQENKTVMEAAQKLQLPHIPALCGGNCACATCHIKVDDSWLDKVTPIDEKTTERDLLEMKNDYDIEKSRLSCQIHLTNKLNGIIIHLLDDELL